jgi:hypothetical protein
MKIVFENGTAKMIYHDEEKPLMDKLGKFTVTRASHVEWEDNGWTVRSAKNPELAIRKNKGAQVVSTEGDLVKFLTREEALKAEVDAFWSIVG